MFAKRKNNSKCGVGKLIDRTVLKKTKQNQSLYLHLKSS